MLATSPIIDKSKSGITFGEQYVRVRGKTIHSCREYKLNRSFPGVGVQKVLVTTEASLSPWHDKAVASPNSKSQKFTAFRPRGHSIHVGLPWFVQQYVGLYSDIYTE